MSYVDWKPSISAEDVFKNFVYFLHVTQSDDTLFWIEGRPSEGGRLVIVRRNCNGSIEDLTPSQYSARSRVYEYGGNPYVVHGSNLYFVNFKDQRIYRQNLNSPQEISPITPEKNPDGSLGKYMQLNVSPDGKWLVFVYEKEFSQKENQDFVGILNIEHNTVQEPQILVRGADFYKTPVFSKSGKQLAWLQWNHPDMPWYSTELHVADFSKGKIVSQKRVAGDAGESIAEAQFDSSGALFFTMDKPKREEDDPENYYNIYRFENNRVTKVTNDLASYSRLDFGTDVIYAAKVTQGQTSLVKITLHDKKIQPVNQTFVDFGGVVSNSRGELFTTAFYADSASKVLNVSTGEIIKSAPEIAIDKNNIPRPQHIEFPTRDGHRAYGYLYLPQNVNYVTPAGELPPVRVLLHGGPVGATSMAFSMSRLFWTSQGYAVFDINYRGSVGYGRHYRDALSQKWGLLEVDDVEDGLKYLRAQKRVGDVAFVSGGSAGGYSVQRLLTYTPHLFQGGASYFGIGNLVTLQRLTHKYESHFLEHLIGGTLETNQKEYEDRSPINHLDKLAAPMIIFQGSDDKVVPPENSREMADILKKRGIYYEYYEYPGEGHGFVKKENLIDSLEKEAAFFKKILLRSKN